VTGRAFDDVEVTEVTGSTIPGRGQSPISYIEDEAVGEQDYTNRTLKGIAEVRSQPLDPGGDHRVAVGALDADDRVGETAER
jgi:hypothetical protein